MNKQITILTATYNRAHLLPDLYASLCRQTSKTFTWFIVDDGSEDNTKELVTGWMQKGHDFEIEYHYIQNGGKNRAINYGVKHINTPYTMIVDSDDYLTDDAIEYLTPKAIEVLKDKTIAGISALKGDKEESPLQQPRFGDRAYITANNLERANYGLERDACEVYKTDILLNHPFEVWKGEKFVPEEIVWNQIALEGLSLRWYNKVTCIVRYQEEGLTKDSFKLLRNNPMGYAAMYNQRITLSKSVKEKFYNAVQMVALYILANKYNNICKSRSKYLAILAIPFGYILSLRRRYQYINQDKNIIYLQKNKSNMVSDDVIYEFEDTIKAYKIPIKKAKTNIIERIAFICAYKLGIRNIVPNNKHTISMLMGTYGFYSYIYEYQRNLHNHIYLFDAWFSAHHEIELFCKILNIENIFVSSYIATQKLNEKNLSTKFHWIPEAINIENYHTINYKEKSIDVLQFGRKYEDIQDNLVKFFSENSISYVYEKNKGEIIFKTREQFTLGLANAKISLCFPRSITHPEKAMGQETMTIRYLQSMASKTLVVGICPEEMKKLFKYNPIIDLDLKNPGEHIKRILDNYEKYIPLIEKNYNEVLNKHQWSNRLEQIKQYI